MKGHKAKFWARLEARKAVDRKAWLETIHGPAPVKPPKPPRKWKGKNKYKKRTYDCFPKMTTDMANGHEHLCPIGFSYIYVLVDPRDDTIRYVGKTERPHSRLGSHLTGKSNYLVRGWMRTLRRKRAGPPQMHMIDMVRLAEWENAEKTWIAKFRAQGDLYNIHEGGTLPPEMRR